MWEQTIPSLMPWMSPGQRNAGVMTFTAEHHIADQQLPLLQNQLGQSSGINLQTQPTPYDQLSPGICLQTQPPPYSQLFEFCNAIPNPQVPTGSSCDVFNIGQNSEVNFSPEVYMHGLSHNSSTTMNIQHCNPTVPEAHPNSGISMTVDPIPGCSSETWSKQRKIAPKRKERLEEESSIPNKRYLSEEKMTQHFQQLSLNNMYTPDAKDHYKSRVAKSLKELEARLADESDEEYEPKPANSLEVVIHSELMKLTEESILPRAIMDKIHKPSMELVLWKPPNGVINDILESVSRESGKSLSEKIASSPDRLAPPRQRLPSHPRNIQIDRSTILMVDDPNNNNSAFNGLQQGPTTPANIPLFVQPPTPSPLSTNLPEPVFDELDDRMDL